MLTTAYLRIRRKVLQERRNRPDTPIREVHVFGEMKENTKRMF